jgi:hypothetical protein
MAVAGFNAQSTLVEVETATPNTYVAINGIRTFSGPGGQANVIDATTLQSTGKEKLLGLKDEGQFSLASVYLPTDPGQLRLQALRASGLASSFRVTFSDTDGTELTFDGFCMGFTISGGVDELTAADITIEITGAVTVTST